MGKIVSFTKLFPESETDAFHKCHFRDTIPRTWTHAYWNCWSKNGGHASGSWPSTTMWLRPTHHMFEIWILADGFLVHPHATTRKSERKNAARVTKGCCTATHTQRYHLELVLEYLPHMAKWRFHLTMSWVAGTLIFTIQNTDAVSRRFHLTMGTVALTLVIAIENTDIVKWRFHLTMGTVAGTLIIAIENTNIVKWGPLNKNILLEVYFS